MARTLQTAPKAKAAFLLILFVPLFLSHSLSHRFSDNIFLYKNICHNYFIINRITCYFLFYLRCREWNLKKRGDCIRNSDYSGRVKKMYSKNKKWKGVIVSWRCLFGAIALVFQRFEALLYFEVRKLCRPTRKILR